MSANKVVPLHPPKLKARLEHFKIRPPTFMPTFDRIFVAPLKAEDLPENAPDATASGIVVPETTKSVMASQIGLLVAAGPKAIEELYSYGIGLGDIVVTARFSPHERRYFSGGRMSSVLILRAAEVVGCEDLATAFDKGDLWYEMQPDGKVIVCDRESPRDPVTLPEVID